MTLPPKEKDPEYWKQEYIKCTQSPFYFFTNYVIINGKPAKTWMSEEDFNFVANGTMNAKLIK